tara:strand:- start:305 stop:550 length:246 start_codon:yes stop_codon:yes gene_type:complete
MTEKRYFIYGRRSCPFCCMACDFLGASKKQYHFFDHHGDEIMLQRLKKFYNYSTFPMILENCLETGRTKFIGGYSELIESK